MAFKNAVKILLSKFGLCWVLLLYLMIVLIIVGGLSAAFLIPMIRAIENAGINELISGTYQGILNGDALAVFAENVKEILEALNQLFKSNKAFSVNMTLLLVIAFLFVNRFLLGLYELPMMQVLDAKMSSDTKLSFTGCFIGKLGVSCRFVLAKMIYTIIFDFFITLIIYFTSMLFKVKLAAILAPFLIMTEIVLLFGLRYTFLAMWASSVVCGPKKIFRGLEFSFKKGARHFLQIFSTFAVTWIILISINVFFALFTFGAGLIVTVPVSLMFIGILNMTIYFGKNNRRYYADGAVITPPVVEDGIE